MAQCATTNPEGLIVAVSTPVGECTGLVLLDSAEFRAGTEFDGELSDTAMYGVLSLFVIGYGIGLIVGIIKKFRR